MSIENPTALYLLAASLLIVLLHFLRSRERRREVSALFLWEGLPGDPQSKAARLKQHIDPLLLLQLGVLLALTFALAQPWLRLPQRTVSGLAIVIDGSASMQTRTSSGSTRYQEAVEEAIAALDRYPSDRTLVIQLSEQPRLLARSGEPAQLAAALRNSRPTWYADGTADGLITMLGSEGGVGAFDRIVVLSDRPMADLPQKTETILFPEGDNVGLTAFSVRQDAVGAGVTAFVKIMNATRTYVDTRVRITDGENQTTLAIVLPPETSDQYVIPFPASRGSIFTAVLDYPDDLDADNRRYFALDRPIDVRVFWIGEPNRYLSAALRASAPVTEAGDSSSADLIIVNQRQVPAIEQGVVLLLRSGMEGVLTLGDLREAGSIVTRSPTHPLLRSVDPEDLRVRHVAEGTFAVPIETLLETDGIPVLAEHSDPARRLIFLMADLMDTNLPVTVDFPIFVRNLLHELVRIPSGLVFEAPEVGDFISLQGRGHVQSLTSPGGQSIPYSEALLTFCPQEPGVYALSTDRGTFALAVSAPASETALTETAQAALTRIEGEASEQLHPLWPMLLAVAAVLLLAEILLYARPNVPVRRST